RPGCASRALLPFRPHANNAGRFVHHGAAGAFAIEPVPPVGWPAQNSSTRLGRTAPGPAQSIPEVHCGVHVRTPSVLGAVRRAKTAWFGNLEENGEVKQGCAPASTEGGKKLNRARRGLRPNRVVRPKDANRRATRRHRAMPVVCPSTSFSNGKSGSPDP